MIFETGNINREVLNKKMVGLTSNGRIHYLRAIILYNTIIKNKAVELIDEFREISQVGYSGKYHGKLNKECTISLLYCNRDILMMQYLGLKSIT